MAVFGEEVAAIVNECSDDKSLAKWQRKKHQVTAVPCHNLMIVCHTQIEAAARKSFKAKLVSLGDKLHNLRDLATSPPPSWDPERTQHYFTWCAQVYIREHTSSTDNELFSGVEWVERN